MKANRARLEIAGVAFDLSSIHSVSFKDPDPLYRPFIQAVTRGRGAPDIRLRLTLEPMPRLDCLEKVFDTEESWSLRTDGNHLWLSLNPSCHPEPLWIAKFDRKVRRVLFYDRPASPKIMGEPILLDWPLCYPLDQLLLMHHLGQRDGLLAHAAGLVLGDRGFVFAGCSGAGKSTLARLLESGRVGTVLSDERMVLRRSRRGYDAFGTPWAGTEAIARNGKAPLAALVFLKHGPANAILPISPSDALDRLLPACSIPWYDQDLMPRIILFCKGLVAEVPAFEFGFKPDPSAPAAFLKFLGTLRSRGAGRRP